MFVNGCLLVQEVRCHGKLTPISQWVGLVIGRFKNRRWSKDQEISRHKIKGGKELEISKGEFSPAEFQN